jgi:RNA polymerase-binding protein DksA
MAAKKPNKTVKKSASKAGDKTAGKKKSVSVKKRTLLPPRNSQSVPVVRKSTNRTQSANSGSIQLNSSQSEAKPKALQVLTKTYLTQEELEHFKQILLEKLRQLTGDVDMIESEALRKNRADATGDLSSMPIHMADMGSDTFEQDFTLGLMSSERKIVAEIIASLKRIQDGTYGICEGTGRPIPKARLEANPWARYCVEYASRLEKGQLTKQEESQRWANRHKAERRDSEDNDMEEEQEEEVEEDEEEPEDDEFEPVETDPDLDDLYEIEEDQPPKQEDRD